MNNQKSWLRDEVSLGSCFRIIIKKWKVVAVVFLIVLLAFVVVGLKKPKVYKATSVIELGRLNGSLVSNQEAKALLLNKDLLAQVISKLGLNLAANKLQESIISDIKDTNLLKLEMVYHDDRESIGIINTLVESVISQWQELYNKKLSIINSRILELEEEIANTELNIAKIQSIVTDLPKMYSKPKFDISLRVILLQNSLPEYADNLSALLNERNTLRLVLLEAKEFRIFEHAHASLLVFNIRKHILLAGVVGFFFGFLVAFFVEFWERNKLKNSRI